MTQRAVAHLATDLAAQLADQVAIENACLALVTVYPDTPGRVDVYLPEFVTQRGFEPPGRSPAGDRFWTEVAAKLGTARESRVPMTLAWRAEPTRIVADWLSGNRWVLTWTSSRRPDMNLAPLLPLGEKDALVRIDSNGVLLEANKAYFNLGWGPEDAIGKRWTATVPVGYAGEAERLIEEVTNSGGTIERILVTRRHPPRWLHVRGYPIMLINGEDGIEITLSDVTANSVQKPEVMSQLMRDHLTGALNRRAFFNILDSDVLSPTPFETVIFIDVQGFKSINDTWGHLVGDLCLVEVARSLVRESGPSDLLARLGGDEFVLLATADSPVEQAVREWSARPIVAGGHRIPVSIRAGIAHRTPGQSLADLVPQADHAVTAAKHDSVARVLEWSPTISQEVTRRGVAERALREAFETDQIVAHFQPLVNLDLNQVVGFEALLRVRGDDGTLRPAVVVETARRLGLADTLARRVAECAFTDGKALLEMYPGAVVEVNLSREYLASGTAIDSMISIADQAGIRLDRIVFELTEELAEGIPYSVLRAQIERAQRFGIGLMIDDFGRGETSLSLLRDLHPSGIKLDRSLVPVEDDREGWRFVEGAVAMLSTLTDKLIVEGIERPWQSRRMHDLGVATQQGWLFGKAREPTHWLNEPIAAVRP